MAVSPQDRQLAIDVFAQMLVDNGMEDDRATDCATDVVDQAIAQRAS